MLKNIKKNIYWRVNKYLLSKENREQRYIIKNKEETVDKIVQGCSISRYGDGEFSLVYKTKGINFQDYNPELSKRLREILKSNLPNHIVAIPSSFIKIDDLTKEEGYYWSKLYFQSRWKLKKVLDRNKVYYDSLITRFYMPYIKKDKNICYIKRLIEYFQAKDILILEGENTRFGLGNSLLSGAKSISRIILPAKNSYTKYDEVMKKVVENYSKDTMILIALGPTATVLAYDLCKSGFQAIDIGHMDIEYEWYLMGANKKVDIPNKSVNEVSGVKKKEIDDVKLKQEYNKQIKAKLL